MPAPCHPAPALAALLGLALLAGCATPTSSTRPDRETSHLRPAPSAPIASPLEPPSNVPWIPLFTTNGPPAGWVVRSWNDVSQPAPPEAAWQVVDGVLLGSRPRGTWLVSELEYGDFNLELEFRLGDRGQSGVGVRFPIQGDPADEGLEIQLVDPRYFGTNVTVSADNLTGALTHAVAPSAPLYRAGVWNSLRVACRGSRVEVVLNGQEVTRVDLADRTETPSRGRPLASRPRRGHLGFQEVSRGPGVVEIRNARLQVLD